MRYLFTILLLCGFCHAGIVHVTLFTDDIQSEPVVYIRTTGASVCTLQVGLDTDYDLVQYLSASDTMHYVHAPYLNPDTHYYYRVIANADTVDSDFWTAPRKMSGDYTLAFMGDPQGGIGYTSRETSLDSVVDALEYADPRLLIVGGDLIEGDSNRVAGGMSDLQHDWDSCYFEPMYDIAKGRQQLPVPGNHCWGLQDTIPESLWIAQDYEQYLFNVVAPDDTLFWTAYFGEIAIIGVSPEVTYAWSEEHTPGIEYTWRGYSEGGAKNQVRYAIMDKFNSLIASVRQYSYIIVVIHEPMFWSGTVGGTPWGGAYYRWGSPSPDPMGQHFVNTMRTYDVSACLSGHTGIEFVDHPDDEIAWITHGRSPGGGGNLSTYDLSWVSYADTLSGGNGRIGYLEIVANIDSLMFYGVAAIDCTGYTDTVIVYPREDLDAIGIRNTYFGR